MGLWRHASGGLVEGDRPALIGVEDVRTPPWIQVFETMAGSGAMRILRMAPVAWSLVVRLAWRTSPGLTVLAAGIALIAGCVTALGLLATATVFTQLLVQGPTPQRVMAALPALAWVMAAYAARGLLDAGVGAVQAVLARQVELGAQDELHAAVMGVELVAFDDADFVELVKRASQEGLPAVRDAVIDGGSALSSAVSFTAAIVTAGLLNPVLALVVLLAAAPQGWASVLAAKLDYESLVRMISQRRRLGITSDLITGRAQAAEVRAFTLQAILLGEHRRIGCRLTAEAVAVERRKTAVRLLGRGLAGIGVTLAYGVLGVLLHAGFMALSLAGAAAVAMRTASTAASATLYAADRLYENSFFLDLLFRGLEQAHGYHRVTTGLPLPRAPQVIEVLGVSFTYPGKDEPALHDVSLTIRRGQTVALVGENGSGKSTLAKVITGLYLPDKGRVSWDGVDIAQVDPRQLHSQIALVGQNPAQWPMTAKNNVRIGRFDRADPDGSVLAAAATASRADTVVTELPQGWDSVLSREFHNGCDLSGGQWQRISVARALYRNASLIIADEPTAAMDAKAEHAVFKSLHALSHVDPSPGNGASPNTCPITVLISHRLANIRHADQIIVLDHGRIIDQGTHQQLMARGGAYAELFTLQARTYLEDTTRPAYTAPSVRV